MNKFEILRFGTAAGGQRSQLGRLVGTGQTNGRAGKDLSALASLLSSVRTLTTPEVPDNMHEE